MTIQLRYFFVVCILLGSISVSAQNLDELRKEQQQKQDDISYTNKLLNQTGKQTSSSLNQLKLLNKKIRQRESLISSINGEIAVHEADIMKKELEIEVLQNELTLLRTEYARIVQSMHKNKHDFDNWLFILSSADFNQAYRRMKYLEQYTDYRKKQVVTIQQKDSVIKMELDSLRELKIRKSRSLDNLRSETSNLLENKKEEDKLYQTLKSRQNELKKELARKKKEAEQIKKMMDKILEAERKKASDKNKYTLTPEEAIISGDFARNYGKIPWPTQKGVVITTYGEQNHPVLKGIKVLNTGIDISTEEGAEIRAIFDGEVRDIWSIKGKNMAVIIKHGEYYSVYQNLIQVKVKIGDRVKTKDPIGTVYTDKQEGNNAVLHFEIWKGAERQNPELWIAR